MKADPEIETLQAQIKQLEARLSLYRRRDALKAELDKKELTDMQMLSFARMIDPVISATCLEFGIDRVMLTSRFRAEQFSIPRHVAMAVSVELGISTEKVGFVFHRDHGTVHYAIKATANRCDVSPEFRAKVDRIRRRSRRMVQAGGQWSVKDQMELISDISIFKETA